MREVAPVFVNADTAAQLCQVSRDTFDTWVKTGFIPPPAIDHGQVVRWHWPTLESRLAVDAAKNDPFVTGARNAGKKVRPRRIA
jgi:predicted DNA-binding transcriptional regulator AlpA